MTESLTIKHYPPLEEKINILSHGLGFILSSLGLILLIIRAVELGTIWHMISFTIFGVSLMVLYAASTIYHSAKIPEVRTRLRIVDHASIYVLIAGTYTPFTVITLNGFLGWSLFAIVWSMAIAGIILKLFFTGKYSRLSTVMYVLMGWLIVFAVNPLIESLSAVGMRWLVAGGIFYTAGAVIYSIKNIKFNHSIFHIFVLIGSMCHFITVYAFI